MMCSGCREDLRAIQRGAGSGGERSQAVASPREGADLIFSPLLHLPGSLRAKSNGSQDFRGLLILPVLESLPG